MWFDNKTVAGIYNILVFVLSIFLLIRIRPFWSAKIITEQ